MKSGPILVSLLSVLKPRMMAEGYLGVSRYFSVLVRDSCISQMAQFKGIVALMSFVSANVITSTQ